MELTPEQKANLDTWAGQRDSLLKEISILRTENERLTSSNKSLADSNSDIQTQIHQAIGRMAELDKQEKDYENIVSSELTTALISKTRLESEITQLDKQVGILEFQKNSVTDQIKTLNEVYDRLFKQANVLDKIVDHVVRISKDNENQIDGMVSNLKESLQKVIDINEKHVSDTIMITDQLPKLFFDLQRQSLETHKINKIKLK